MSDMRNASGDGDDLEALFDSIVSGATASDASAAQTASCAADPMSTCDACCQKVFTHLGQVTRALYDSLNELGVDKGLEEIMVSIPDAQERLNYISSMTERAAERALNAVDSARPHQQRIERGATSLVQKWDAVLQRKLGVEEFRELVLQTRGYLAGIPEHTRGINAQLTEVVMAQDFQDLTGQVIKRVVDLVCRVESQLVSLLVEASPKGRGVPDDAGGLEGPVVNADKRNDVVSNQKQVDELLESLGF